MTASGQAANSSVSPNLSRNTSTTRRQIPGTLVPRNTLVALLLVPLGLALLAVGDPSLRVFVWWSNALIALLALVDGVLAWPVTLAVVRHAPDVLSLGRRNKVQVAVRSRMQRRVRAVLTNDLFDTASNAGLPATVDLRPGMTQSVSYWVIPHQRGAFELGDHTLRIPSPLGLWLRQCRFKASHQVRVYPDLKSLRAFELLARQDREHAFLRATKLKGGESEFARLREYTRDDEFRSIDWKASAKRRKLTAREYQLESNQNLCFMLDAGRLMTAQTEQTTLFDHALNASLMLSQVAARNGDRIGLLGFDDQVRKFVPPRGGHGAARAIIQTCYDLHPSLVESDYDQAFLEFSVRVRKRALVILFVQVLDEAVSETLLRRTRALLPRHLPLLVIFRDSDIDALMLERGKTETDLYIRAASAELLRWRQSFIKDLRASGVLVLDVRPRELTTQLINHYLNIKARQLL